MPRSKTRKHHHHQAPGGTVPARKTKSAVVVAMVFVGLLGMGIAFFATGSSIPWLLIGAVAGAIAGYFFGRQIDRAFAKKQ